jgi:hypothetical protein
MTDVIIDFVNFAIKKADNSEDVYAVLREFVDGKIDVVEMVERLEKLVHGSIESFRLNDPRELIEEAKKCRKDQQYIRNRILEILKPE